MTARADGFRYLSPWLPMKDGWYRLGHVGAHAGDVVHRWRLSKSHERNQDGDRWERWRLFYDHGAVNDGNACGPWSSPTELPSTIRDRSHAGELVELRFNDLCDDASKARRRGKSKADKAGAA